MRFQRRRAIPEKARQTEQLVRMLVPRVQSSLPARPSRLHSKLDGNMN